MSEALRRSPDLSDLLKIKQPLSGSQKRKKEHVSTEQREELLNFILENPEMVTRSCSKELVAAHWDDVTKKLNAMKPEKSVQFWQNFWNKWKGTIHSKNVFSLTTVDYKLIRFLHNIGNTFENDTVTTPNTKKKSSLDDICKDIEQIEKEKTDLKADIDRAYLHITVHQTQIVELKKLIEENRKRCAQLSSRKANLNSKKKKIEEKENLD